MKERNNGRLVITTLCILIVIFSMPFRSSTLLAQQASSGPALLTYNDLVALYENDVPSEPLQTKLTKLLNTPFVHNSVSGREPSDV